MCIAEIERLSSALEEHLEYSTLGSVAMFLFRLNISTNIKYLRSDKWGEEAENGCESWSCSLRIHL